MGVLEKMMADKSDAARVDIPPSAACWICLDDTNDEEEKLARPCACRGESGFVHVSCAARFAESRDRQNEGKDFIEYNAWEVCANCRQSWVGQFDLKLAELHYQLYKDRNPKVPAGTTYGMH